MSLGIIMGKKLDALLGRSFKTARFRATVALAVSRLAVVKNQRQARCSIANSDVVELLKSGNHDRAIHRVDLVIKEQNMLDVLTLLESYCHLFLERISLIEHETVCPEELQEAVASLIFASTRCGDIPELREIRSIFAMRFGREFAARAAELRNNCGVNPQVIQKLSTRMPSLESKTRMLKEIALDNNIDIHIPDENSVSNTIVEYKESDSEEKHMSGAIFTHQGQGENLTVHDNMGAPVMRKFKDVADAAQAAFESAAYAAAAARVAVEMSRSGPTGPTDSPYTLGKAKLQNRGEISLEEEGVIVVTEAKRSHSDDSLDGSDEDGDSSKRVDGNDDSQLDVKEPLNINRRPISVRTTRAR